MSVSNPAIPADNPFFSSENLKRFILPALALTAVLLMMIMPELALAEDSSVKTEIDKGLKLFKFFIKLFLYVVLVVTFALAGYWVLGSITDWRNKERGGTVGNIALTVVIALMGVGIITILVDKGLTLAEDKLKDATAYNIQIETPTSPPSVITARTMVS